MDAAYQLRYVPQGMNGTTDGDYFIDMELIHKTSYVTIVAWLGVHVVSWDYYQ